MSKKRRRPAHEAPPPRPLAASVPRSAPAELPRWNWLSAPTAFAFAAGVVVMYVAVSLLVAEAAFAVYVAGLFFFFLFGSHIAVRIFTSRRR